MNSDMTKDEVKALRKQMGLTQEQMAVAMGVRLRTVSRWEAGETVPATAARLMRLMASMTEEA